MSNTHHHNIEIQSQDVIKLILQFLKENSLGNSLNTLQEETGINLNIVDNKETFLNDVKNGNWDSVLDVLSTLKLSVDLTMNIYEQIIVELLHLKEYEIVKHLLRKTEPMNYMKLNHQERYLKLENYLQREYIDLNDFYKYGITTEKKRKQLIDQLNSEITTVPSSRLLSLLSQSLHWQKHTGVIPTDCTEFDLFKGELPHKKIEVEEEATPNILDKTIKFNTKNKPESVQFSPDSKYLVTGSIDGFIEVWDYNTGKLSKNLAYQANDDFMMHDDTILSITFSKDGEYMATGSLDSNIKVWQIKTGKCLRKFEPAHTNGVTCLQFSKNSTQILSGSFDSSLKIHGLKSGKALKIFRGHQSFVNDCSYNSDEDRIISCSSDGKIKIWDAKTSDCLQTITPTQVVTVKDIAIRSFFILLKNPEFLLVCNSSSVISIVSMKTQTISKTFSSENNKTFLCCTLSPQQNYLYAVAEDNELYCFDLNNSTLVNKMKIHEQEVIAIAHHPTKNILATISADCLLKTWINNTNKN
ncbi:hypothetical protein DICPUDRAFT_77157 [Dictyostelium purpureum]|uniref:WD40 repeat-containing protein SMU1 n=1 Tax=Dictyostelium purpureum TaxID=5786 RepID=F0ZFS3_DICPU|nr:uncharacterized protein DICPUDRAFT_77157 [Dictyostelium purpureum]EGC37223.1 hypothetical protein DICPUDRAFT_77157 [Dictyostelium purpureum]|eukprot:XP_003286274.1 hypothetical protein DICPUDRAFT_77157 [Dictyostelium purpureum]